MTVLTILLIAEAMPPQIYIDLSNECSVIQTHVDIYIYLTPRLIGDMINDLGHLTVLRKVKPNK